MEATWKESRKSRTIDLLLSFPSDVVAVTFHLKGEKGILTGEIDNSGFYTQRFREWSHNFQPYSKVDTLIFEYGMRMWREHNGEQDPRQARDYYRDIVLESEDRVRTLPSSSYRREAADPTTCLLPKGTGPFNSRALSLKRAISSRPRFRPRGPARHGEPAPKRQRLNSTSSSSSTLSSGTVTSLPLNFPLPRGPPAPPSSPVPELKGLDVPDTEKQTPASSDSEGVPDLEGESPDSPDPADPMSGKALGEQLAEITLGKGEEMRCGGTFPDAGIIDPISMNTERAMTKKQKAMVKAKRPLVLDIALAYHSLSLPAAENIPNTPEPKGPEFVPYGVLASGNPVPLEPLVKVLPPLGAQASAGKTSPDEPIVVNDIPSDKETEDQASGTSALPPKLQKFLADHADTLQLLENLEAKKADQDKPQEDPMEDIEEEDDLEAEYLAEKSK